MTLLHAKFHDSRLTFVSLTSNKILIDRRTKSDLIRFPFFHFEVRNPKKIDNVIEHSFIVKCADLLEIMCGNSLF